MDNQPLAVLASIPPLGVFLAVAGGLCLLVFLCARVLRKYVHISIEVMDNQAWVPENGNGNGCEGGPWLGEEVRFQAADGHPLSGVIMCGEPAKGGRWEERGAVIFAHEFASDRSAAGRYCQPLVEEGFDVLAFDFRGHGASDPQPGYHPRQWPSDRETSDMRGAIRFLHDYLRRQGRTPRIALFGLSRGACTSILACKEEEPVCAIVAEGAYSSDTATEYFMRRFASIFAKPRFVAESHPPIVWTLLRILLFREYTRRSGCRFPSVRKSLRKMGRMPILFIHGEKDSYIPVAHCQALYDLADGPKSLWIVPEARHNQCMKIDPPRYVGRLVSFLSEYVSVRSHARSTPIRSRRIETAVPATSLMPALSPSPLDATAV